MEWMKYKRDCFYWQFYPVLLEWGWFWLQSNAHIGFNLDIIIESLTSHSFFERTKGMKDAGWKVWIDGRVRKCFPAALLQFMLIQGCCIETSGVLQKKHALTDITLLCQLNLSQNLTIVFNIFRPKFA